MSDIMSRQVGGSHYMGYKIQPLEFGIKRRLIPVKMNALKYVLRHQYKNGVQDLDKAIDYLEKHLHFKRFSRLDAVPTKHIIEFVTENNIVGAYRIFVICLLRASVGSFNYERCIEIINQIKKEEYDI